MSLPDVDQVVGGDPIEERLVWGQAYQDADLVFAKENGDPLGPDDVSKAFKGAVKTAGARVGRLHDLRHSHASLGLAAGVPLTVMSRRLGHSSVSITGDVYSHVEPRQDLEAAATIAALYRGMMGPPVYDSCTNRPRGLTWATAHHF